MKSTQIKLFRLVSDRTEHGGEVAKGKRKVSRPIRAKQIAHVVLRSKKAKGELNFLRPKHAARIERILRAQANKHIVKLHEYVNVGNHLHLKLRPFCKKGFQNFLRSSAALIARAVTGAKKGKPFGAFWDGLAYSRVLKTRAEEWILRRYFIANSYEAEFGRMARDTYLSETPLKRRIGWRIERMTT